MSLDVNILKARLEEPLAFGILTKLRKRERERERERELRPPIDLWFYSHVRLARPIPPRNAQTARVASLKPDPDPSDAAVDWAMASAACERGASCQGNGLRLWGFTVCLLNTRKDNSVQGIPSLGRSCPLHCSACRTPKRGGVPRGNLMAFY